MNNIAIRIEGISKQYRIGGRQEGYKTLRDTVADAFAAPLRRARRFLQRQPWRTVGADEILRALEDISFNVTQGEVVGLIGRNGAGKSTLLKILSRITEPTTGFADIHGRVGSLLEVGTGFHAELTGRENIYLNGAILGMRRAEIDRKFDEIVAFAGVEKFIDTPVKHYSSGMYLRLAFAVAAHLETEILLVDEVLAVGDAAFQKKCLNKMQDVGRQGRTIIFVSHNMSAITRLCERTILLDQGKILADGPSYRVVSAYLNSDLGTTAAREWPDSAKAPGGQVIRLKAVRVRTADGLVTDTIDIRQPVGIEVEYDILKPGHLMRCRFLLRNEEGIPIFVAQNLDPAWRYHPRPAGRWVSIGWIPGNLLAEGTIVVTVGATIRNNLEVVDEFYESDVVAFHVHDSLEGDSARGDYAGHIPGIVRPLLTWTNQCKSAECELATIPLDDVEPFTSLNLNLCKN